MSVGNQGPFTVLLDKAAVQHAADAYNYTPATETSFKFNLKNLLEFVATFAGDMTRHGLLEYSEIDVDEYQQVVDLRGLFEVKRADHYRFQ